MTPTPSDPAPIRRALTRWYRRNARDLPWRRTRDPYAIWVSEVMLQQTQVATIVPYYGRFLERFPTVMDLACASLDSVLKVWEGLGYYARARSLHKAARVIRDRFAGVFPRTFEEILALPGVGPYTAGAIASIALGQGRPVLDGNVQRVLCRIHAIRQDPHLTAVRARLWTLAGQLVARGDPGDLNQALMELGAVVCVPRGPRCDACPVARLCRAHSLHLEDRIPRPRARKPLPLVIAAIGVIYRPDGKVLIDRRPAQGLLGGLWEFPGGKRKGREPLTQTVQREVREELGIEVRVRNPLMRIEHAYTHFRIRLHVFTCDYAQGIPRCGACTAVRWVRPADLRTYAFPKANQRIIAEILKSSPGVRRS